MPSSKENKKTVATFVTEDTHRTLRLMSAITGESIQDLAYKFIKEGLNKWNLTYTLNSKE